MHHTAMYSTEWLILSFLWNETYLCLLKLSIIAVLSIYSDKQADRCGIFEKKKIWSREQLQIFSFGENVKLND